MKTRWRNEYIEVYRVEGLGFKVYEPGNPNYSKSRHGLLVPLSQRSIVLGSTECNVRVAIF